MHPGRRYPALPVAVCFAAGIGADRWLATPLAWWWCAGLGALVAWAVAFAVRQEASSAAMLLSGVLAAGGLAHHLTARVLPADDVSRFAADDRRLVFVRGVVSTAPEYHPPESQGMRSAWAREGYTQCTIDCRALLSADRPAGVSGRVRLSISGEFTAATTGDVVELTGWLIRPRAGANPGEFDFREYLARQGIRATVSVEHPAAVRSVGRDASRWFSRGLTRLRERCAAAFEQHLSERARPVALALMLGDRSLIGDDLREAFAASGMLHVLAISGLHVGILALFLWSICRLLNLGPLTTAIVLVAGILGYATLTHVRPPIVRAAVFIVVLVIGRPWHRRPSSANLLGVAALVVLASRPTDLFDAGTQLSFLAVGAILFWHHAWGARLAARREARRLGDSDARWWRTLAGKFKSWLLTSYGLTACISLCTLPLIAAQFHIVSPVGLVLNVGLAIVVLLTLWCGYVFVAAALVAPPVAGAIGAVFDILLSAFLAPVEWAAGWDLGHRYVAGPAGWWLAGFYLLAALLVCGAGRRPGRRAAVMLLSVWLFVGLAAGARPERPAGVRCTFLAVGHGSAVLMEFPNGRTVLYDAGALDDSRRAARVVAGCLWSRGYERLDVIVVSHADLDHFNAVPELVETLPVGCVLAPASFVELRQPQVAVACERIAAAGVPLRVVGAGDRLKVDHDATISIVQPDFGERFSSDNASSAVLLVEYAGRRILLPGDLEDDGLTRLLTNPPLDVDVLLSPHHGSLNANPPELAAWATPEYVVVSRGRFDGLPRLREIYGEGATVYATGEHGAVTFEIGSDGGLECAAFLESRLR